MTTHSKTIRNIGWGLMVSTLAGYTAGRIESTHEWTGFFLYLLWMVGILAWECFELSSVPTE